MKKRKFVSCIYKLFSMVKRHNATHQMEEQVSLHEVLVKTSYTTQITESDTKNLDNPVGFGSGFIVQYDSDKFFVTADHTIHKDDYKGEIEERTWKDYVVSIFNNYTDPNNFISTLITPLDGFYYMEQFHLDKSDNLPRPVDICVCKMKAIHLQNPFLTDQVTFTNGEKINAGEHKFTIQMECFEEPNNAKKYFVFGKVKTKLIDNILMESQNTFKESLKFETTSGDFLLFNTQELITDKEDWEGLSGSPVFSEDGKCVGVLSDVLENSKSIWVIPISKVKMLIEVAIQQEVSND
jgi:S1-C subfamily serine protease